MDWLTHYVVDWDKVQTLDDLKRIIAAVDITFELDSPHLKSIKDLLREEPKGTSVAVMD